MAATENDPDLLVNARDIKEGARLLVRYTDPSREPVVVIVDEVVENEDGTYALTVTPEHAA